MKKVLKILLIIIIILAVLIGGIVVWQWENISALLISVKYTSEDIEVMVKENDDKINAVFDEITEGVLNVLSDEEREKLLTGKLSEEELVHVKEALENPEKQTDSGRVDEIISKIYILRAEYVNKLAKLETQALEERKVIKQGGVTVTELVTFVDKYTGLATSFEKDCDAEMNGYIKELDAELKRLGRDASIISEIRSVYKNEKELKKSQLLDKYGKYL